MRLPILPPGSLRSFSTILPKCAPGPLRAEPLYIGYHLTAPGRTLGAGARMAGCAARVTGRNDAQFSQYRTFGGFRSNLAVCVIRPSGGRASFRYAHSGNCLRVADDPIVLCTALGAER